MTRRRPRRSVSKLCCHTVAALPTDTTDGVSIKLATAIESVEAQLRPHQESE